MSIADKITEAELEVMRVVWDRGEPVPLSEIRDALAGTGWTQDTIHTLVRRLHQKGVLHRQKNGVYYYTAAVAEADYLNAKTKQFVSKVYGGNVKGLLSTLMDYDEVEDDELKSLRSDWRRRHGKDE